MINNRRNNVEQKKIEGEKLKEIRKTKILKEKRHRKIFFLKIQKKNCLHFGHKICNNY